ncbi:long-chain fatty acid--CoA ligase [Flavihumibacter sp. R14]|nr:long-chain fatty acid--CoA ligase [Flavihumibacter soli]
MKNITSDDIFSIGSLQQFEKLTLDIFRFQAANCHIYSDFLTHLGIDVSSVLRLEDIPYLPIEFFKTHQITSSEAQAEITFTSSGTTGTTQSKHPVTDLSVYEQSYSACFQQFYGDIRNYAILALLPSYQEREGSSLIYMIDDLIQSGHSESGYFLYNHNDLAETLNRLKSEKTHTILIGVTYALLDFAESHTVEFPELIVMETGGMKGKRREMIREELHEALCQGFGVPAIHSEYGMTELLSQAYSKGGGLFHAPAWMKISIRNTNDPLELLGSGQTGGINVIDLANLNSCSFIATQDLGKVYPDGSFEILGRFDNSDIRGCNLLIQ